MDRLEKLTLVDLFNYSTEKFADKPFVSWMDKEPVTYSEFKEKVLSVTKFLKEQGIVPGDKVAILSENSPNWSVAYFAITTMGAVGVPIMTEFHESEVHHVLRHSESKAIFVSEKFFEKVAGVKFENLTTRILLDDFSIIPDEMNSDLLQKFVQEGQKELAKIKFAALKLAGLVNENVEPDDLALIYYTSGTTGHSKGVMLSHKNIVYDAVVSTEMAEVVGDDRLLSILPLFHTIESTLGMVIVFYTGASVFYLNKPPTASVLVPALKKVKPTVMIAVPLVIEKIYKNRVLPQINSKKLVKALYKIPAVRKKINKAAGKKLYETFGGNLKMLCIGGAALNPDVEQFLREAEFPYAMGYGLTETAPLLTGTNQKYTKFQSSGKPMEGVEVKIINKDEQTGEGDVIVRAPNVMMGYYKDPEKTAEVLTEDGWFHTGDLGYLSEDNYLYLKGRSKNVIIGANGKNIYPEELESVINSQDCVVESLVVERDNQLMAKVFFDSDLLDEMHGLGKLSENESRAKLDSILKELQKNVNGSISGHSKIHKFTMQTEPFEKTPTHKIKRYLYS